MTRAHPRQDAVLAALADGAPRKCADLEMATGLRRASVLSALRTLIACGLVVAEWDVRRGDLAAAARWGAIEAGSIRRRWRLAR